MKGRPPGTPKSDDPAKKKRKRFARERDLCDVKIKITEHFPDATFSADGTINASPTTSFPSLHQFPDGIVRPVNGQSATKKYWTIQRVNGNGGNGKGDGVPGPHKHTLQKSDEIKKSTVQRFLAAQEKEAKKGQVRLDRVLLYVVYLDDQLPSSKSEVAMQSLLNTLSCMDQIRNRLSKGLTRPVTRSNPTDPFNHEITFQYIYVLNMLIKFAETSTAKETVWKRSCNC